MQCKQRDGNLKGEEKAGDKTHCNRNEAGFRWASSRMDTAEERISELKDILIEAPEMKKKPKKQKTSKQKQHHYSSGLSTDKFSFKNLMKMLSSTNTLKRKPFQFFVF